MIPHLVNAYPKSVWSVANQINKMMSLFSDVLHYPPSKLPNKRFASKKEKLLEGMDIIFDIFVQTQKKG